MSAIPAVVILSVVVSGCASTSGRDWLNSPIDERAPPTVLATTSTEPPSAPRPRLSHTVTLGETYASAPEPVSPVASGASVQVNVQTQVPVVVNHFGGYGYGYGYSYGSGGGSFSTPVRVGRAASAAQQVGADFPAVRDYGPRAMR